MDWFEQHRVDVLARPTRSPDQNPIENLWRILKKNVYANERQFKDIEYPKQAIKEAWK